MSGIACTLNPGEGAFYGPKLEFVLKDAIGRDWQCGTIQADLVLPQRLEAYYIGSDGAKHHPVMLHRVVLGSIERFVGILLEQYAGKMPLWLAPTQIAVVTITNDADDYAKEVKLYLDQHGFRSIIDLRSDKVNFKIREHSLAKVPVILVLGRSEMVDGTVSVRRLGGTDQVVMHLAEAASILRKEIDSRVL
jgi:threonyl-tRNA synthetase